MVDATRFALDVTLWGQEADVDDSILDAHPVVALTNIQIREWRGRAASTYSTTRIRWNPDLPATTELAEWYSQVSILVFRNFNVSELCFGCFRADEQYRRRRRHSKRVDADQRYGMPLL